MNNSTITERLSDTVARVWDRICVWLVIHGHGAVQRKIVLVDEYSVDFVSICPEFQGMQVRTYRGITVQWVALWAALRVTSRRFFTDLFSRLSFQKQP